MGILPGLAQVSPPAWSPSWSLQAEQTCIMMVVTTTRISVTEPLLRAGRCAQCFEVVSSLSLIAAFCIDLYWQTKKLRQLGVQHWLRSCSRSAVLPEHMVQTPSRGLERAELCRTQTPICRCQHLQSKTPCSLELVSFCFPSIKNKAKMKRDLISIIANFTSSEY